jgi:hypothetical protein
MRGQNSLGSLRSLAWMLACALVLSMAGLWGVDQAQAQDQTAAAKPPVEAIHLGVSSCAGSTCHGAVQKLKDSYVEQNEYLIWSRKDKHAKAYSVLLEDRAVRIARNLNLPDAHTAKICLDCHADNVAEDRRGPEFQLSDGVGCEACHGGAKKWLGVHISGSTHADNVNAGLYATESPVKRAEKCLSCHFGDEKRFATHRIMGAGHPRLSFELDTFTAVEPAHFVVDKDYVQRKGPVNDVQVWAIGQAMALVKLTDALLDPQFAPKGLFPELSLFDCTACHHGMTQLRWEPRSSTGLPPGTPKLYDANAVMLKIIAGRVAPAQGKALAEHMLALHRATTESWANVQREAREVKQAASDMIPIFAGHDFSHEDMHALATGLINDGLSRDDVDYPGAEQTTMALSSIIAAMRATGGINDQQAKAANDAMNGLYESVGKDETYKPAAFVAALKEFQKSVPQ